VLPRAIHLEVVPAGTVLIGDGERRHHRHVTRAGLQVEAPLPRDGIEHDVGLEQIGPRRGHEQLVGPDRAALGPVPTAGLDPDGRLGDIARGQEA